MADTAGLIAALSVRCTFPTPGIAVTCAFSGGADSTALLALAQHAGCEVTAIHVDHGLRPSSKSEAELAAMNAESLGVPFRSVDVSIEPGPNLEARARTARFAVLPAGVLTGHTADDQAETVLINLIRGAGIDGLAGMEPGPTKPLLSIRRTETVALCDALGLTPIIDPSNTDARFVRNRIRSELLPLLDDIAGRDVAVLLARTAAVLRKDADLLDELASPIDPTDAKAIAAAEPALARRAMRGWLARNGYPPDLATVNRALDVARGTYRACELGNGNRLERQHQRLRIVE